MKPTTEYMKRLLIAIETTLSLIILLIPLRFLEILSLEVIGEPPINGKSWIEGVNALGGELSMRILGIIGVVIIIHTSYFILKLKNPKLPKREVSNVEFYFFFLSAGIFLIVNFLIGYAWWDPEGILGMGPLFWPSILSLFILGALPFVFKRYFKFESEHLAASRKNFFSFSFTMVFVAYGYGLVSLIWHCCSFYNANMFFFFYVIKLIQLWGMCSFFFMYGFRMLLNRTKPWIAYLTTSILFGFCYPWHTIGFAVVFIFFGLILCHLTRKTSSFLPGLILLYFAYIFHAGLAWQGAIVTFAVIYPISILILVVIVYSTFRLKI